MALAETTPELLGIRATVSCSPKEETFVSTSIQAIQGTGGTLWRSGLPVDSYLAHICLFDDKAKLHLSQQGLTVATHRLETYAHYVQQKSSGLPFDHPSAGALLPPEAELSRAQHELRTPAADFGLGEQLFGMWEQGVQKFHTFVHRLLQAVTHNIWVETYEGEYLLGQTTFGWKGDIESVWQQNLTSAQVVLHQGTLALALVSRIALIRVFCLAARGAILLSSALTLPGEALLILPAVWKFIDQVQEEYREHKSQIDV